MPLMVAALFILLSMTGSIEYRCAAYHALAKSAIHPSIGNKPARGLIAFSKGVEADHWMSPVSLH